MIRFIISGLVVLLSWSINAQFQENTEPIQTSVPHGWKVIGLAEDELNNLRSNSQGQAMMRYSMCKRSRSANETCHLPINRWAFHRAPYYLI